MSVLSAYTGMMNTAQGMAMGASVVLPPVWVVNFQFKSSTGEANNLDLAGQEWRKAGADIKAMGVELQESVRTLPQEAWNLPSRQQYEQRVTEFVAQTEAMGDFFDAVGISLTGHAYSLFTYAAFAVGMGIYLDGCALAAVTVVAYPACLAAASTGVTITWGATAILAAASAVCGATFQIAMNASADTQSGLGNTNAQADYKQAQAVGSAAAVANLGQNGVNLGLNLVNSRVSPNGIGAIGPGMKGVNKGIPLQAIDLDADRDKDQTWNVGGGATVMPGGPNGRSGVPGGTLADPMGPTYEGGGHIKWGDKGFAGGDAEGKYTNPNGDSYGGNVSYEDTDGIGSGEAGTVGGGGNMERGGVTGEAGGEYNMADDEWKGNGQVGASPGGYDVGNVGGEVQGQGGDVTGATESVESIPYSGQWTQGG